MPPRELYTIGDLGALAPLRSASPLRRQAVRRRVMTGIGATIANWAPPAGLSMTTAGAALQAAATTLQNYLDTNGIPPESTSDPQVLAFQQAWDADPLAGKAQLDQDGGYGPNSQAALAALTGLAPPYNPGSAVATNTSTATPGTFPWGTAALVGGAALAVYFLFFRRKRSASVTVRTNPRRRKKKRTQARRKGKR